MTLVINGKTYEASELIAYVENLEKENAELKDYAIQLKTESAKRDTELTKELTKAKELLTKAIKNTWSIDCFVVDEINDFLKEIKK